MGLTNYERARIRGLYAALVTACLAGDHVEIKALSAQDLLKWQSPMDDTGDAFMFFALARLAYGFSRTRTEAHRAARRPALTALALLVDDMLRAEEGPPRPTDPPPQLPFRADLDG